MLDSIKHPYTSRIALYCLGGAYCKILLFSLGAYSSEGGYPTLFGYMVIYGFQMLFSYSKFEYFAEKFRIFASKQTGF